MLGGLHRLPLTSKSKGSQPGAGVRGVGSPLAFCVLYCKEAPCLRVSVFLLCDGISNSCLAGLLSGSNERTCRKLSWYKKETPETWGRGRVLRYCLSGHVDRCHSGGGHPKTPWKNLSSMEQKGWFISLSAQGLGRSRCSRSKASSSAEAKCCCSLLVKNERQEPDKLVWGNTAATLCS